MDLRTKFDFLTLHGGIIMQSVSTQRDALSRARSTQIRNLYKRIKAGQTSGPTGTIGVVILASMFVLQGIPGCKLQAVNISRSKTT
jgi:hypothetical protein